MKNCLAISVLMLACAVEGGEIPKGLATDAYFTQCIVDVDLARKERNPQKAEDLLQGCVLMSGWVDDIFLENISPEMLTKWRKAFVPYLHAEIRCIRAPSDRASRIAREAGDEWDEYFQLTKEEIGLHLRKLQIAKRPSAN